MRADELDLKELIHLDPDAGVIRFAGQRAILVDTAAMGLLRKYLVDNFGQNAARAVLTQFGYAHGFKMAEAMKAEFKWASPDEWRLAGTRMHTFSGLYKVDGGGTDPMSGLGMLLSASYEAEQHVTHFGQADTAVCWTLCGLTSGYLSCVTGDEVCVLEDKCLGKGDAGCHLIGHTRAEWGDQRGDELRFFESLRLRECLDDALLHVTDSLKTVEKKLKERHRAIAKVAADLVEPSGMVARSQPMRTLVDLARRVAKVDSTVLITGESGSGKERVARLLHDESTRAAGPFIAVNCGAITQSLLEGELFGHARGAFTGATSDRPGLFEAANGGTLLLDEVGEISPAMQVTLLRALQEREIRRVGENKVRRVDVRIVAATNRDLTPGVVGGTFRRDLYYRLKVVELAVPPLRLRREDLLPLARILLAEASLRMKRSIITLSPAAADHLLQYEWPGNVRELENAMERAVALADGPRVELDDLPREIRHALPVPAPLLGAVRSLEEVEKDYILAALELNGGNQTHTAVQLKIGPATLYRRLKAYGLIKGPRGPKVSEVAGVDGAEE